MQIYHYFWDYELLSEDKSLQFHSFKTMLYIHLFNHIRKADFLETFCREVAIVLKNN